MNSNASSSSGPAAATILAQAPDSGSSEEEFEIKRGKKAFEGAGDKSGYYTEEEPYKIITDEQLAYCFIVYAILGSFALYLVYRGLQR